VQNTRIARGLCKQSTAVFNLVDVSGHGATGAGGADLQVRGVRPNSNRIGSRITATGGGGGVHPVC